MVIGHVLLHFFAICQMLAMLGRFESLTWESMRNPKTVKDLGTTNCIEKLAKR